MNKQPAHCCALVLLVLTVLRCYTSCSQRQVSQVSVTLDFKAPRTPDPANYGSTEQAVLAACKTLACVLVQPDGWARGEREGYGEPRDVTSLSLRSARLDRSRPRQATPARPTPSTRALQRYEAMGAPEYAFDAEGS